MPTEQHKNFSSQKSAIPFGKYESGVDDVYPCNESMIGREGARAKLIDFLTNAGTRKAILVTGRRGMGKTSFVQYCLHEYEQARVERYWRSEIGRTVGSMFWLAMLSIFYASGFVVGSRILQLLLFNATKPDNSFLWIPTAFLVLILSYPIFHAGKIISTVLKSISSISNGIIGVIIVTLFIVFFIYFLPGSGSPIVALSRFLVGVVSVYLLGELLDSYNLKDKNKYLYNIGGPLLFCFGLLVILAIYFSEPVVKFEDVTKNNNGLIKFISNVSISLYLLGMALLNRAIGLSGKPKKLLTLQINSSLKKSKMWFVGLSSIFIAIPIILVLVSQTLKNFSGKEIVFNGGNYLYIIGCIFFISCTSFFKIIRNKPEENSELCQYRNRYIYPSSILTLKAIFLVMASLYTLHPLLNITEYLSNSDSCTWGISDEISGKNDVVNDWLNKHSFFLTKNRPYCNTFDKEDSSDKKYISLFPHTFNEILFILTLVLIVTIFFWIEYEWIIRPDQLARRDRSMSTGIRPSYFDDLNYDKLGLPIQKLNDINSAADNLSGDRKKYEKIRKEIRNVFQKYIKDNSEFRNHSREYESVTFLGFFNHFNLSTIVTTINLGFEELDHKSVIQAMLLGVREQYYRKFVSLRSPRVIIRTLFKVILAMILVADLAQNRFNLETEVEEVFNNKNYTKTFEVEDDEIGKEKKSQTINKYISSIPPLNQLKNNKNHILVGEFKKKLLVTKYCMALKVPKVLTNSNSQIIKEIDGYSYLPKLPKLMCELGGFYAETLLPILYFELVPIMLPEQAFFDKDILKPLFDIRVPYFKYNDTERMSFCVYHGFLFAFVFFLFRRVNRRAFEIIPYTFNLEKIDDLLNSLTSTTKIKRNIDFPTFARYVTALSGGSQESEKNIETEKLDPRIVELKFMNILEQLCYSRSLYFKPLTSGKGSPTIEITFIFDELDKLANDISSQQKQGNPDGNDSELHRLNLMKSLLSNMKRIITSSEARYIFLGGRLLHDDWLADGARRQPLLTSIFSDEIYLPALLTDANIDWFNPADSEPGNNKNAYYPLHERIEEYFAWQYYLSRIRYNYWSNRIWMPIFGLRERDARARSFIQTSYKNLKLKFSEIKGIENIRKLVPTTLYTIPIRSITTGEHLNCTIYSTREVSRLNSFIQFLAYRSAGNPKRLNELLGSFIISVDRAIPNKMALDKGFICQDVIYLPDHKVMRIQLIARVYQQLRKGFEEKIRGRDDKTIIALIYMSDFLFKFHARAFSWENLELIDELVHMHRGHDLRSLLHDLVEHYSDRYLHRIINGMYTYRFRSYFAKEIEYLSRHSEEEMAAFNFTLDEAQSLREHLEKLLTQKQEQKQDKFRESTDILGMLGELHEFYQEYERARYYYRSSINASHLITKEFVGDKIANGEHEIAILRAIYTNKKSGREALLAVQSWAPATLRLFLKIALTYEREHNDIEALNRFKLCINFAETMIQTFATMSIQEDANQSTGNNENSAYILEYLGLLFEPVFAYSWLLEKNSYTSGNSLNVMEQGVSNFEKLLIEINSKEELNFVRSQWNKKLGALCFYKGYAQANEKLYVEEARFYYTESAKSLSSYFRKHIYTHFKSKESKSFYEALLQNHYPSDYCLSVAECLGDLSESILAQITPSSLFENCSSQFENKLFEQTAIELIGIIDKWFFDCGNNDDSCLLNYLAQNYQQYISFNNLKVQVKFDLALNLSLVSSFYLLRSGNLESAGREAIHTLEVIAQYLKWYWQRSIMKSRLSITQNSDAFTVVILHILKKIIWCNHYLEQLFQKVRFPIHKHNNYLMGDLIPSSTLTAICSIGLSLSFFLTHFTKDFVNTNEIKNNIIELCKNIRHWTGEEFPILKGENYYAYFNGKLIHSLQRHRYPVLNQLNALTVLIDASLIQWSLTRQDSYIENTYDWLVELYHLNQQYNQPLHFSPMQYGLCSFLYLFMKKDMPTALSEIHSQNLNLDSETRRYLVQSLDMCFMGKGYYQAIDKLYYLYDDFNDSQIHRNHALQMAGSELTNEALLKIRKGELSWN